MTNSTNLLSILYPLLFIICSVFILGCEKDSNENLVVEELFIDEALQPYFDRFIAEGTNRGYEIDLTTKKIEGFLLDIQEDDVAGQCSYSPTSTRKVNIDINYWENATDLEREFVVFHELGHCYLEREHSDVRINRNCTSIMHSGTSGCRFNYTTFNRSDYLDELF